MPRHNSALGAILVCTLLLQLFAVPAMEAEEPPFPDMARSWYRYQDAVKELTLRKVISGNPDGTFKPTQAINRAEFLKILFTAKSDIQPSGEQCFWDIPEGAWYAPYVCAAKRRGIVKGYPAGNFKPEQVVNIAEAIKMIVEAYGKDIEEPKGELWYKPYADALNVDHVFPSFSYVPQDPLTRERAADLIWREVQHDTDRVISNLSPGCGKSGAQPTTSVMVNGVERTFLLTVPRNYVSHDASPLIIAFHGRTNSNEQVRSYFGLDRRADEFFIAYPAGISNGKGAFSWADPGDTLSKTRDIAFFDAMVKNLSEAYCIDMDRIFVAGHSLGAWMANTVACFRGGIVRGSATVGGSSVPVECPGPSAAMIINNPKDPSSSHTAAVAMKDLRVRENGCSPVMNDVEPRSLLCQEAHSCLAGDVIFCPHTIDKDRRGTYYPHQWPDGAAEAIVGFFRTMK